MQDTIVLYPGVGLGHLNPMVALASLFLRRGLAVTIALIEPFSNKHAFGDAVKKAVANNPSISFHVLPPPDEAPASAAAGAEDLRAMFWNHLSSYNSSLLAFLRSTPHAVAVVIDFLCVSAIDVTAQAGVPGYVFFATGAADLSTLLHWAHIYPDVNLAGRGDDRVHWPGVPPFPASDFPQEFLEDNAAKLLLGIFHRIPDADGVLVNSFESLEEAAVQALRDGSCIPGRFMPPVYCVGPVVGKGEDKRESEEQHECLAWLDEQPERSVVFLCFGSMGSHSEEQWKEMAVALERAGHRFLFVVRAPRSPDLRGRIAELGDPDLDAVLPEAFLERTKGRGLVVKRWAPQVEVLNHPATGAFVTHCGWNSTLEGITAGLPLLCYPLYAEQRLNKVFIVEAMRVGVELRGYDKRLVSADELEEKIRWVMESDGGKEIRERVEAVRRAAEAALREGGSSSVAADQFVRDLKNAKHATGIGGGGGDAKKV